MVTLIFRRILFALVLTPLLGVAVPAAGQLSDGASGPVFIERVLVKVNGEIITQTDLEARQIAEIRNRGLQPRTDIELSNLIREVTPAVIANAVDELLLVQRGKDLGYQLTDEQFDEIVTNLRTENQFETEEEFVQALQETEGLTMDDLRRLMEHQMLVSQVQQVDVLSRVAITDVEAREYYAANIEEFTTPATATLREILIALPESPAGFAPANIDESRVVAQTTVARLRAGEDFATVANEVSDSPSRSNGGLIGPLLITEYSDQIQELIASLEVGEVTDPVRTPQGFQIVMLEERTEAVAQPFEDVRDQISTSVFNDRRLDEYTEYLDALRAEAIIEWRNEELRLLYERARAEAEDARADPELPGQG